MNETSLFGSLSVVLLLVARDYFLLEPVLAPGPSSHNSTRRCFTTNRRCCDPCSVFKGL